MQRRIYGNGRRPLHTYYIYHFYVSAVHYTNFISHDHACAHACAHTCAHDQYYDCHASADLDDAGAYDDNA
jgi:hypothetical protein